MPKLHLVPIAALPDPMIEADEVSLRIVTDRQWGSLVPPQIVSRKPKAGSRYVVAGSAASCYGWVISLVSARIFVDIDLMLDWTIDSSHYRGGCDHRLTIRLLPAPEMRDPVWSMDLVDGDPCATGRIGPAAAVSIFERAGADTERRYGRMAMRQTLDLAPMEMSSLV